MSYLESRFQQVWEKGEFNIVFVNDDLEVVRQMPMTLYVPAPNDAGKGTRGWRRGGYQY